MKRTVLSIVAVVLLLSQGAARSDEATEGQAKDVKSLQGEWRVESIEVNGEKQIVDKIMKLVRFKVKANEGTTTYPNSDGTTLVESEQIKVDPSKSPKHLDLLALDGPSKGKTHNCIYSLEKDEFKYAMPLSLDDKRPTKFTTGKDDGDAWQIIVLRRVK